jgi:hypothetical protein
MAYCDLTADFHTLVQGKERKKADSQRVSRNGHSTRGKEFVAEAYNIVRGQKFGQALMNY